MRSINATEEKIKLDSTVIVWILRHEDGEYICNRRLFSLDEWESVQEIKKQIEDAAFRQDTAEVDRLMALRDAKGKTDPEKRFRTSKDAIEYFAAGNESFSQRAHKLVAKYDPTLGNWEP